MPKKYNGINVYEAAIERINFAFDNFKKNCVSFSAGKDSGVMMHIICREARKRGIKVGVLFIDWECQFTLTEKYAIEMFEEYKDVIDLYWIQIPIKTWNACSMFEPEWTAWEESKKNAWVRSKNDIAITDYSVFDFYYDGIMFEEFVPLFSQWYAKGESCAQFVGIRSQESLNRFRTIARDKPMYDNKHWTTNVIDDVWNVYPIYDWKVDDIWIYNGKNSTSYNKLYDRMHQAGMTISQMRICEPFGDESRKGLWLYQIVEPYTWSKLVLRVSGANTGKMYSTKRGNIMGNHYIDLPPNKTWEQFALSILSTIPKKTSEHYKNKIMVYISWWSKHGYPNAIPQESDKTLEAQGKAPSWRKISKTLLKNDYWCKGLGFSPTKTSAYKKYCDRMKEKRKELGIFSE